jgi:hypothetical protein
MEAAYPYLVYAMSDGCCRFHTKRIFMQAPGFEPGAKSSRSEDPYETRFTTTTRVYHDLALVQSRR